MSLVTKKRRQQSVDGAVTHTLAALQQGSQQDAALVRERMNANEDVARALASLLRSQTIDKALQQNSKKAIEALGKP